MGMWRVEEDDGVWRIVDNDDHGLWSRQDTDSRCPRVATVYSLRAAHEIIIAHNRDRMTPADDLVDKIAVLLHTHAGRAIMNCPKCGLGMYNTDSGHYSCAHCRSRFRVDDEGVLVDRFSCPCCGGKSDVDSFCSQSCAEMGAGKYDRKG